METWHDLGAMGLQVDAKAAVGIIGRQGLGKVRHLDVSFLWLQAAVRGKSACAMYSQATV